MIKLHRDTFKLKVNRETNESFRKLAFMAMKAGFRKRQKREQAKAGKKTT